MRRQTTARPTPLLIGIFFCSGAAALIFEMLWLYECGLVFGNGVWSASLVLAAFMGGLALGGGIAARAGAGLRRGLRTYALIEALVGVAGVGLTVILPALEAILAPFFRPMLETMWLINSARLFTAFALLLLPCTAMGLTLPLLVAALSHMTRDVGPTLGRLYGWNVIGAVVGVLPRNSRHSGAGESDRAPSWQGLLNISAACLAGGSPPRYVERERSPPADWPHAVRAPPVAAALAGANLLAYEVIGFRFLSMFVLNAFPAMSLMLASVLLGSRRRRDCGRRVCGEATCIRWPLISRATCVLTVVSYGICIRNWHGVPTGRLAHDCLSRWLMTPVSFMSGVLFTLQGASVRARRRRVSGWLLTLANTLGSALGALSAGFLLLPLIGMERSIFVLSSVRIVGILLSGA